MFKGHFVLKGARLQPSWVHGIGFELRSPWKAGRGCFYELEVVFVAVLMIRALPFESTLGPVMSGNSQIEL